ncbi:uncharacterized protein I206_102272 [Kwoniella pini CBS 10737]|uniref:Aminoglycoside phosphotransferase domain-containing protein n=1 Tax=Kwoniella pini CBS 10737 TaxID=1296096 RepID=A0A1B9HT11_9TREE|nr:uncharacterized protein I206_07642 [Kwoniella pini CBS 10737]OCF46408.1 hypothetical protein I206_07642 [Kwoniella pini CBS 10737]
MSIISEVTTLKILKKLGVPVPGACLPAMKDKPASDVRVVETRHEHNGKPLQYFLYEYISGSCMPIRHTTIRDYHSVEEQTIHIIQEYGKSQIKMFDQPIKLDRIGILISSVEPSSQLSVGPMLSFWGLNYLDPPYLPGPFKTNQERYLAQIDIALSHIGNGWMNNKHTLDAYLWHLLLKELVETCLELAEEQQEVFVRHPDAKGDIFLVDGQGDLAAILDWECAYVTTKAEAFSSPLFLYNTYVPYEDRQEFTPREDILIHYYEQIERFDLASYMRNGKKYQQLDTIGRFNRDFGRVCSPWQLMDAFTESRPTSLRPPLRFGPEWTSYLTERYQDDQGLQKLLSSASSLDRDEGKSPTDITASQIDASGWYEMTLQQRHKAKEDHIAQRTQALVLSRNKEKTDAVISQTSELRQLSAKTRALQQKSRVHREKMRQARGSRASTDS